MKEKCEIKNVGLVFKAQKSHRFIYQSQDSLFNNVGGKEWAQISYFWLSFIMDTISIYNLITQSYKRTYQLK